MSLIPQLSSFLSNKSSPSVLWCYTGAGHFFEEIFDLILDLNRNSIPICFVFSNAGALVANRYGLFWKLIRSDYRKEYAHFIFEEVVAKYNIQDLLQEANFSYTILPKDPTFSAVVALANSEIPYIIACPLTANTASKLVLGVADSLISNLLSAGRKAGKKIGILPTDSKQQRIKTKLPTRQINPSSTTQFDITVCKFKAIEETNTAEIIYSPQYCVGCQACVKKFPNIFSYGDKIEINVRKIDSDNIQRLCTEFTVFNSPSEILPFINQTLL
ncbi:MAG: flavoprotein [Candidatus Thorarchaeota archaeon]